jgi:hypothetical protein
MNLLRIGTFESPRNTVIRDGLVLQLDASSRQSYIGSGNTWSNLASQNYNGTLTNNPSFTEENGGAIVFDGVNDNVVIVDDSETLFAAKTSSYITLQTWVYFESLRNNVGGTSGILSKQSLTFTADGYSLRATNTGALSLITNGGTISKTHSSSASSLVPLKWYFITAIIKISSEAASVRCSINDVEVISSFHGNDTYNEDNSLMLGRGLQTGFSNEDYLFGKIGAFYFYDRELKRPEVVENFNQTRGRFGV